MPSHLAASQALLATWVEPEGEHSCHAGHDDVGHQRDHHRRKDQRAHQRGKQVQPLAKESEDDGHNREDREPGDDGHLVAGRRRFSRFRGQREPGLEARKDVDLLLLVQQGSRLAEPVVAFLGVLPGVQIARVVEAEDDPVLVILGVVAGTEYLRSEIARELVRGGEDAGDPLFELSLAALLDLP